MVVIVFGFLDVEIYEILIYLWCEILMVEGVLNVVIVGLLEEVVYVMLDMVIVFNLGVLFGVLIDQISVVVVVLFLGFLVVDGNCFGIDVLCGINSVDVLCELIVNVGILVFQMIDIVMVECGCVFILCEIICFDG